MSQAIRDASILHCPMYITETGAADKDSRFRRRIMEEHCAEVSIMEEHCAEVRIMEEHCAEVRIMEEHCAEVRICPCHQETKQ
jgi:hypothetical protein